jgi:hypothetical protein
VQAGLDLLQHALLLVAFLMFISYVQVATAATQLPMNGLVISDLHTNRPDLIAADKSELEMHISGINNHAVLRQTFHGAEAKQANKRLTDGVYVFSLHKDAVLEKVNILTQDSEIEAYSQNDTSHVLDVVLRDHRKTYQLKNLKLDLNEDIEIRVRYHQAVQNEQGKYELSIPMLDLRGTDLHIELDAGFPVDNIVSPTHAIHITNHGEGRYSIRFRNGQLPGQKDFQLIWFPEADDTIPSIVESPETGKKLIPPVVNQSTRHKSYMVMQSSTAVWLKIIIALFSLGLAWGLRIILFRFYSEQKWPVTGQSL